jgi:flavin reductase (DIM6/NTAB) family NADH-FMN oxidoreductase RutF
VKQRIEHAFVFPDPVVLVTVAGEDGEGTPNIITIAWVGMACSDPVAVTIAVRPSRHSHGLLVRTGEFAVNVPGAALTEQVDLCGTLSGRDVDKWERTGLTPEPARHISAPLIRECSYALECRVVETVPLGAHDLFVGQVLAAHADEDVLDEKGRLRYERIDPLTYLPFEYHRVGEKVYLRGQSGRR